MEVCKADWRNHQKLLRRELYKEQSLKRLNSLSGYITLPCRHSFTVSSKVTYTYENLVDIY